MNRSAVAWIAVGAAFFAWRVADVGPASVWRDGPAWIAVAGIAIAYGVSPRTERALAITIAWALTALYVSRQIVPVLESIFAAV